ncbi:hypothetical protein MTR_3g050170 [Medicago truncatula]|uniref:Transmembrane protein n=1 Tax=Medicago truncatula TaxID=3880 RepID=G7J1V9_MEDTR|nr:hypothetical protein MTR_3g050170 [Medicago truncatula]
MKKISISPMSFPLSQLSFLLPLPFTNALDSDITFAVVDFPATVCIIVSARQAKRTAQFFQQKHATPNKEKEAMEICNLDWKLLSLLSPFINNALKVIAFPFL